MERLPQRPAYLVSRWDSWWPGASTLTIGQDEKQLTTSALISHQLYVGYTRLSLGRVYRAMLDPFSSETWIVGAIPFLSI